MPVPLRPTGAAWRGREFPARRRVPFGGHRGLLIPRSPGGAVPPEGRAPGGTARSAARAPLAVHGRTTVKVEVVFRTSTALLVSVRLLKVAEPTAGPWPGSGSSLAQMPKPDLASNASPLLLRAGDRDVGEDGVGDRELRLAADVVGLEHDAAVRRVDDVDVADPDALEHLRGREDPDRRGRSASPQKWPPARTSEMFSNRSAGWRRSRSSGSRSPAS